MKCADIQKLINRYVDGEINPEEKSIVQEHIASCTACKEFSSDIAAIKTDIAKLNNKEVPGDFVVSLMRKLDKETQEYSLGWEMGNLSKRLIPYPVLASLIIAFFIFSTSAKIPNNNGILEYENPVEELLANEEEIQTDTSWQSILGL